MISIMVSVHNISQHQGGKMTERNYSLTTKEAK